MKMIKNILFKVISIAIYTFFPPLRKVMNATPIKLFVFQSKPVIQQFSYIFVRSEALFSESVAQWCEQMIIQRSEVWRISGMRQYFPTERLDRFPDPFHVSNSMFVCNSEFLITLLIYICKDVQGFNHVK